jgi:cytochrome P450
MILLCAYTSHLDSEYFVNPKEFNPDRFLESYEPKAHRFAWRPFERGPRACSGQELAFDMMRVILLLTVRWFDFEHPVEGKVETPLVNFTDWDTRIGIQAFQGKKLGAGPRNGMKMKAFPTGRPL